MPSTIDIAGAGAQVTPEGSAGLSRAMNGDNASAYQELEWSTPQADSVPLEVVIQVVEISGALTAFNLCNNLRWQIYSWSHGGDTYDVPPTMGQAALPADPIRQPQWPVLARGVVVRLTARRMRVNLRNAMLASEALVRCTINPLASDVSDRYPFPLYDQRDISGRSFFPMGSREFRLLPAGVGGLVDLYGFSKDNAPPLVDTRMVADFVDWSPIGNTWFSYVPPAGTVAEYR